MTITQIHAKKTAPGLHLGPQLLLFKVLAAGKIVMVYAENEKTANRKVAHIDKHATVLGVAL